MIRQNHKFMEVSKMFHKKVSVTKSIKVMDLSLEKIISQSQKTSPYNSGFV